VAWRWIAIAVAVLCLTGSACGNEVIYNGLPCNSLCQAWMGTARKQSPHVKRNCAEIVTHSDEYDTDLVRLCEFVAEKREY